MFLAVNNVIEASDRLGVGMDLRAWASGSFNPGSANASFNRVVDVSVDYDIFGDPDFLYVEFSNGYSLGLLLEAGLYGVFATSEATFTPFDGEIGIFIGYGLSTAPRALGASVEDAQFYISWDELAAIEMGWASAPLSFFSLAGHDEIHGNRFADNLVGAAGDDLLFGGGGSDGLWGGSGDDTLSGGGGNDRLRGDTGDDSVKGGGGADTLIGGDGDDMLSGDAGHDRLGGGGGRDGLFGGGGRDRLVGGGGNDDLRGGGGDDLLLGGGGRDTLSGGRGDDTLVGGAGPDRFVFGPRDGVDLVRGFRNGQDQLDIDGARGFGALDIDEWRGDAMISYRGVTIVLEDVSENAIDPSDFIF